MEHLVMRMPLDSLQDTNLPRATAKHSGSHLIPRLLSYHNNVELFRDLFAY
jgi:hypothetical protein